MTFGERVKELRLKKGLSQRELGERMGGITQQTIAQYEKSENYPKLETIRRIAKALDVPFDNLVPFDDGLRLWIKEKKQSTQNNISGKRKALDKKIDQLNDDGIQKMSDYADDIIKIPEYRKEDTSHQTSALNAAHERADIEVTEEMKKHDDDIMNDDSEWN